MELDVAQKWVQTYKDLGLKNVLHSWQSTAEGYAVTLFLSGEASILKNEDQCREKMYELFPLTNPEGAPSAPVWDSKSAKEFAASLTELVEGLREPNPHLPRSASEFLARSKEIMDERAKIYDSPSGERSAARTVEIFNILTGHELTEKDGWLFLLCLKLVRQRQVEGFHRDSVEDMVTYAALLAESMAQEDRENRDE